MDLVGRSSKECIDNALSEQMRLSKSGKKCKSTWKLCSRRSSSCRREVQMAGKLLIQGSFDSWQVAVQPDTVMLSIFDVS